MIAAGLPTGGKAIAQQAISLAGDPGTSRDQSTPTDCFEDERPVPTGPDIPPDERSASAARTGTAGTDCPPADGGGDGGPTAPGGGPQQPVAPGAPSIQPTATPPPTLSGVSIRIACTAKKAGKTRLTRCRRAVKRRRALELRFTASAPTTVKVKVTQQARRARGGKKRSRARTILTRAVKAAQGRNTHFLPLKRAKAGQAVTVALSLPGGKKPVATVKSIVR